MRLCTLPHGQYGYSEHVIKAGQTYLPSGNRGMRVQPAGVYIERIYTAKPQITLRKLIFYAASSTVGSSAAGITAY